MRLHYPETAENLTPEEALVILKEGNKRFLNNLSINRNVLQLVNETAEKQFPVGAILSCSDSRVPVELVFDQGLGDLFSVRLAGNIASIYATASIEYAIKNLGSKLIVVMGHTGCGAIKGACDHLEDGQIHNILEFIEPAVDLETTTTTDRNSSNKQFVTNVVHLNVKLQMENILRESDTIRQMVMDNNIGLVGAVYDMNSGEVKFLETLRFGFGSGCV